MRGHLLQRREQRYVPTMLPLAIESVDERVLLGLVDNQVSECRDLEFKRDLPGGRDDDTKEFLADVSSLANAQGGDLLFGIEEANGVATAIVGVHTDDADREILRLENMVRDGLEPRIVGIRSHWISLASGHGAIVMRIPASISAPHRIRFRNSGRFYNRTSRGKYEMDVSELRDAFTQAEGLPQRFRQRHAVAVEAAQGVDFPFRLRVAPAVIATCAPLGLFRASREMAVARETAVLPPNIGSHSWMVVLEGLLVHAPIDDDKVGMYALNHSTGQVDVGWAIGETRDGGNGPFPVCWPDRFEGGLWTLANRYRSKLTAVGIDEPWVLLVTVRHIKEYMLAKEHGEYSHPAWREAANLPQLVIEDVTWEALAPVFASFWRLFGEERPANRPTRV